MEDWLPIEGYPGYEVSSNGRIKSYRRYPEGRILKPRLTKGYPCVSLCVDGVVTSHQVHILVLETFVGPRPLNHETAHLDSNRANPKVNNLKWVTSSENKYMNSRVFKNTKVMKITLEDAREIRELYTNGGFTQRELCRKYGLTQGHISNIINGREWKEI